MDEPIGRYYDESKNPEGGLLPGVPLRDISQAEFDNYPAWLQASIDAHPMYRKTQLKESKEIRHARS